MHEECTVIAHTIISRMCTYIMFSTTPDILVTASQISPFN